MRRVVALDVEGRIGFRIAEALRFLEAGLEGEPLLLHLGQDVVAGAVHDAIDAGNRVAGQRFPQRLDHRNTTGDGGFVVQKRAMLFGETSKLDAMGGKQRLVGGDDVKSARKRCLDGGIGRFAGTTHQFDEDVDIGRLSQRQRIVMPAHGG